MSGEEEIQQQLSGESSPLTTVVDLPQLSSSTGAIPDPFPEEEVEEYPSELISNPVRKTKRQIELARRRQMNFFQKRRKQKQRKVFFNRIRAIIRLVCCMVLLYGIYAFITAPFWQLDKPRFQLINSDLLSSQEVAPIIQKYRKKPLFLVDPAEMEKLIQKQSPVVEKVYIRRYLFPSRLQLFAQEKIGWAKLYNTATDPQPYALVTQDTHQHYQIIPFHHPQWDSKKSLASTPHIILPNGIRTLKVAYLKQIDRLVYQLQSIQGLTMQSVDLSQPEQVDVHFKEVGVHLGRMNASFEQRLTRLIPLVPKINELKGKIDWVDLRWSSQTTFHKVGESPSKQPQKEIKAPPSQTTSPEQSPEQTHQNTPQTPEPVPTPSKTH